MEERQGRKDMASDEVGTYNSAYDFQISNPFTDLKQSFKMRGHKYNRKRPASIRYGDHGTACFGNYITTLTSIGCFLL